MTKNIVLLFVILFSFFFLRPAFADDQFSAYAEQLKIKGLWSVPHSPDYICNDETAAINCEFAIVTDNKIVRVFAFDKSVMSDIYENWGVRFERIDTASAPKVYITQEDRTLLLYTNPLANLDADKNISQVTENIDQNKSQELAQEAVSDEIINTDSGLKIEESFDIAKQRLAINGANKFRENYRLAMAKLYDNGVSIVDVPAETVAKYILIENMWSKKDGLSEAVRIFADLGYNIHHYTDVVSKAKCVGTYQFGKKTYRNLVRLYPRAGLIPDFHKAVRNDINMTMAAILLTDHNTPTETEVESLGLDDYKKMENYLLAAYNGGPYRAKKALRHDGELNLWKLAKETRRYVGFKKRAFDESWDQIEAVLGSFA